MEIGDILARNPLRFAAAFAVALIAAILAGGVAARQPQSFTASGQVFVAQHLGALPNSFEVQPLLADFDTVVRLPSTLSGVVPSDEVADLQKRLSVSRLGEGTSVDLAVTADSATQAESLFRRIAAAGLTAQAQREVDDNRGRLEAVRTEATQTKAELDREAEKSGVGDPQAYVESIDGELLRLSVERVGADSTTRVQLDAQLSQLRKSRADVAKNLDAYIDLKSRDAALRTLTSDAAEVLRTSEYRLKIAQTGSAVSLAKVESGKQTTQILRAAISAFAFIAAPLFVLLFLTAPRGARTSRPDREAVAA